MGRLPIAVGRVWACGSGVLVDRAAAVRRVVIAASLAAVAASFVYALYTDPMRPSAPRVGNGYWCWWDQSRYLLAALAWAHGDLGAANHWYFPGYGLLGALFVHLTPADPFAIVDLLCLLATLWLCSALAAAVAPHRGWAAALGAAVFAVVFLDQPLIRQVWVVPWTTTPATPVELGALLAAMRFGDRPTARDGFLAALLAVGLVLFRPIDALVTLAVLPPLMLVALLRHRTARRSLLRIIGAAFGGAVVPLAIFAAAHLATHGFARSAYMAQSAAIGFEWRLVALRWVTLVVDPRPLFPSGRGLAEVFVWLVPGLAAIVLGASGGLGGPVRRHLVVLGFVALTFLAYFSYRDLHPQGLWHFNNCHYFKCILAVSAIYAALLAQELVASPRRLRLGAASLVLMAIAVCWRADWQAGPAPADPPRVTGPHELTVPDGLGGPTDAVRVHATGDFRAIFLGQHRLRVGATWFDANSDFKAFPVPGGLLFATLRVLGPGAAILTTSAGVTLAAEPPPQLGRMGIGFGLPCALASCPQDLTPGPALATGKAFGPADSSAFLDEGWSNKEVDGRWTDGPDARLRFRPVPALPDTGGVLRLVASGFDPPGYARTRVTIYARHRRLGVLVLGAAPEAFAVDVPRSSLDATGSLSLVFAVHNPRRPAATLPGATDRRKLGVFLRRLELDRAP